jgi:hypothetical protein
MTDYFQILTRMLKESQSDTARARAEVYELARIALTRKFLLAPVPVAKDQVQEEMISLEYAISRVEVLALESNDKDSALTRLREKQRQRVASQELEPINLAPSPENESREIVIWPSRTTEVVASHSLPFERRSRGDLVPYVGEDVEIYAGPAVTERQSFGRRALAQCFETLRLGIVAVAAVAIYVAISEPKDGNQTSRISTAVSAAGQPPNERAKSSDGRASAVAAPVTLRPSVYGVYAIHENRLIELSPIQTTPVDPRLKTVLQINLPSTTRIPDGRLTFLIYRRDLLVSAPERVPIRIVARIARVMKFETGGAVVTAPQSDAWLLRGNGYEFRVLPNPDDREMIVARPDDTQPTLAPGRYALLLNGQPYDFTVDGRVSDPAHCVESAPTARGPVFYDCPPR